MPLHCSVTYPVLVYRPGGLVRMLESEDIWQSVSVWTFAAYRKGREHMVFFGRDGQKWKLKSIETNEPAGLLTRWFKPMSNVAVHVEFEPPETYTLEELKAAFGAAVAVDDDILTQHHSEGQIMKWLEDAHSIAKVFNLYHFIRKDFHRRKSA